MCVMTQDFPLPYHNLLLPTTKSTTLSIELPLHVPNKLCWFAQRSVLMVHYWSSQRKLKMIPIYNM